MALMLSMALLGIFKGFYGLGFLGFSVVRV